MLKPVKISMAKIIEDVGDAATISKKQEVHCFERHVDQEEESAAPRRWVEALEERMQDDEAGEDAHGHKNETYK